jgi:hypothetical protein
MMIKNRFLLRVTAIIFFTGPVWGMEDVEKERNTIQQEVSKVIIEEVEAIVEESNRLNELWLRYYQPKPQEILKDQPEVHWKDLHSNL